MVDKEDLRELYPKRYTSITANRPVSIVRYIPGMIGYRVKEETHILSVCSDADYEKFIEILESHEREKSALYAENRELKGRISTLNKRLDMCKQLLFAIRSRLKK